MGEIRAYKKRGPKRTNPIKQESYYVAVRTPETTEGRCIKCGKKGELGDELCLKCWDSTTDEGLITLQNRQYSRR